MNPNQQGLSVMLTNALRNSPLRFERNILPTKRPQAVILPIGGNADVTGRTAPDPNHVGVRKVQLAAPHPLVAITPADKFRRRMVGSAGMTAEIVQESGSERIEYRFQAPVHLLILFERGVRREGDTDVEGLPRSSLRDLARKFVFVPAGHTYCDWHEPSTPARVAFFYFDPDQLPGAGEAGAIALLSGSAPSINPMSFCARPLSAFFVGLAASHGAAVSMGLSEALSDDGSVTGRGGPLRRGAITGVATGLGGMLHTFPFLIPNLGIALKLAYAVVVCELITIAFIRYRFMGGDLASTIVQVVIGGGIVFAIGVWLGQIGAA
jgi:hypothetical protein